MSTTDVRVQVIDSHTAGEPTRVVLTGGPDLGTCSLSERRKRFRGTADDFRKMLIDEPRGNEAMVGALLCEPTDPECATGVIFFNNRGYLGMCGHGTIGVAVTLAYLKRIGPGSHKIETPVGIISVELHDAHSASIQNVPSYRLHAGITVDVPELGTVTGDVAWGGNWFFLTEAPLPLSPDRIPEITTAALRVRTALSEQGIFGTDGAEIDHVEFFAPAQSATANSRNFVLCPGGAYDRSPCGTGLSAKLACLAADGKLAPGERWVQESIIGSRFEGSYQGGTDGRILPRITGNAYIVSESQLIQQTGDPFGRGIPMGEFI
ncbi:4-hydroxyproline epimerase [Gimesia panareensis]|uniref:4-hydroxyproline epimerase n=1 Tax=Gimesia panareensis TaxID=2527978 RepID=A0A517Q4C2_9PLAN|nr:proline racemase family protein [Gimesia panareensis]QDT26459.1 4-hydroxyproline epimerase [Gimesia panareensis]